MEDLSNSIFDLKEKLTDGEFKNVMEQLQAIRLNQPVMYQITYLNPVLKEGEDVDITINYIKTICYIKITEDLYYQINNSIDMMGCYMTCYRNILEWMGDDNDDDEEVYHPTITINLNIDKYLSYINCKKPIIKIEKD